MNFDPRAKLIWAIGGIAVIFSTQSLLGQICILMIIIILTKLVLSSLIRTFKAVKYLLIFLPITFLIPLIFSTNVFSTLFSKGVYYIDWKEILLPIKLTFRLGNLLLFMAFLINWIKSLEFLDCIYSILKPFRSLYIPIDDLFQVIFIAVRFFPIMREEYWRLDEGWKTFIKNPKESLRHRILNIRETLIPLMIFSFRKAETLADAMIIRGYGSCNKRTYYSHIKLKMMDAFFALTGILFTGLLILFVN
ncbi:MAG: hypothetical protein DRP89_07190 [Candidatus Neomarinimicrobiota bacterium]|nr:MAG: hypothetical protein DRP89_07190 [Candidatus Neomarinimicrobiota bacterium]